MKFNIDRYRKVNEGETIDMIKERRTTGRDEIERKITSELKPFVDGAYGLSAESRGYELFKNAYEYFLEEDRKSRIITKYITRGLTDTRKPTKAHVIQWIFLYLGVVETLGNSVVDILIMLLVANDIDFHAEYRYVTPRIKHVTSIEDLKREYISLRTKLNFLRDNGIHELASIIDSELRNYIAHSKFDIKQDRIHVKGKPAEKLVPKSVVKVLVAANVVREVLRKMAKDICLIPGRSNNYERK